MFAAASGDLTCCHLSEVVRRREPQRRWILRYPIHGELAQSARVAIFAFQVGDQFARFSEQRFGERYPRGNMHHKRVCHPSVREVPINTSITFKFVTDPACNANNFALHGDRRAAGGDEQLPKLLVLVFPTRTSRDYR
jgi:hypothetical protein